jgi:transposase InsO family protein
MTECSRRPHHLPAATETVAPETAAVILAAKAQFPAWGARKLHAILWPPPAANGPANGPENGQGDLRQGDPTEAAAAAAAVCSRTVHRLLARHGQVGNGAATTRQQSDGTIRFERAECNELWQIDYKGIGSGNSFPSPMSILDDRSRFCLALRPVVAKTGEEAWKVLWETFGEYGLPEVILSDNGDGFNSTRSLGPTWLQARLWRVGIKTTHGRVRHPQTQGKVERFHRTIEVEVGHEALGDSAALCSFRNCYNWVRPHESLEMRTPGALYQGSDRARPAVLPAVEYASGAVVRKVDSVGKMSYRNECYRAGRGLCGEYVELREDEEGTGRLAVWYAGVRVAALSNLRVPQN